MSKLLENRNALFCLIILVVLVIPTSITIISRSRLSSNRWVQEKAMSHPDYGPDCRWQFVVIYGYYPNDFLPIGREIKYLPDPSAPEQRDWAKGYVDFFGNVHITYENLPLIEN